MGMDYPAQRRDRLRQQLQATDLDAFVVSHPVNVTYLTGFSGEASVLILGRQKTVLVSDFRFIEQIAEECPGLDTYIRPPTQKLPEAVAQTIDKLGVHAVGFESHVVTVAELQTLRELTANVEWQPAGDRVEILRMVKDESELAQIEEAIHMAQNAYTAFRSLLRPGDCEKDLADAMEGYVRRAGGRGTSFPTIIAVAERAALPHAPPTERTVGSGELLLIDWGACGRLYKSDLTRTVATRKISTKLEEVYAVVLKAQQQAIAAVRPGAAAQSIDAAARGIISEAGFGPYFGHGLGHGIGLQVHEGPAVRPGSPTVLQPDMVFTVEPGIYLPDWGGVRIEDDVLVTPDGCRVLTDLPRHLESLNL
jgi:Xaa-Pro aminopeptidase